MNNTVCYHNVQIQFKLFNFKENVFSEKTSHSQGSPFFLSKYHVTVYCFL